MTTRRFTSPYLCSARPVFGGAFTLVELLVVISIISLLIAILLPALGSARKIAKQTVCMTNLRQIGVGVYAYTVDFKDYYMPRAYEGTGPGYSVPSGGPENAFMKRAGTVIGGPSPVASYKTHMSLIFTYLQNGNVFSCPAANSKTYGWTYTYSENWAPWVQLDGSLKITGNSAVGPNRDPNSYIPRMGQEKYNKDKIIYMDGRAGWFGVAAGDPGNPSPMVYGSGTNVGRPHLNNAVGRTDVLFIDGHVESLQPSVWGSNDFNRTWFRDDIKSTPRVN